MTSSLLLHPQRKSRVHSDTPTAAGVLQARTPLVSWLRRRPHSLHHPPPVTTTRSVRRGFKCSSRHCKASAAVSVVSVRPTMQRGVAVAAVAGACCFAHAGCAVAVPLPALPSKGAGAGVINGAGGAGDNGDALCNLSGNWTSSRAGTPPADVVHIEFFQEPGQANFTLRATPWGSTLSYGHVVDAAHADVFFVGGSMQTVGISASGQGGGGPACTFLSSGWCKFPFCDVPEPAEWPPWSPPTPVPPPPPLPPPPTWAANWNLTESTTIQPSSDGYFAPAHPWGLVSLDWSVARSVWFAHGRNNTNCEAVSIEGCRQLKATGKAQRCFIYHNMELALEWEESQRKVMYDPTTADYFLQYTDGLGHKNGTIYQEDIEWGDQFFWDFTNPAAADYFVTSVVASLDDPAVDGTFTDDVTGLPAEHEKVMGAINMTAAQLQALQAATAATHSRLVTALVKAGKYNWQAFGGGDGPGPTVTSDTCVRFMRQHCAPGLQDAALMMGAGDASRQVVAAFLIVRPPIGFLGYGWESDDKDWNDIFYLQPGTPRGVCEESQSGVFTREWSNGNATLDCNTWEAAVPFPSLKPGSPLLPSARLAPSYR